MRSDASSYETFSSHTALLTIMGDPIRQARSPQMVNAILARRGLDDMVMVPLHVTARNFPAVIGGLRGLENFRGSIFTMPHKESVVALLDALSPECRQTNACNVLRRDSQGYLSGTMLDGEGFVAGLRSEGYEVAGRRIFLAGAGGAASGIAFALGKHGAAALTRYNRTRRRAEQLAERVKATWPSLEVTVGDASHSGSEIAINGTLLGMKDDDPIPMDPAGLAPGMVAAGVVIRREATPFLAAAARRGCAAHNGLPMLAGQIDLMIEFMLSEEGQDPKSGETG